MNNYIPLARKYRPQSFADLMGQEIIAKSLANAVALKREPHAVIFTGVRGVGKTTVARIYAKALNCEQGPTPTPCNICESCKAITIGVHEDMLEIDGASNTGVDDVRQLIETVSYIPQRGKFKIYLIDEVHMLSTNAFNALLKTLEEPPTHVVFLFATTELQKIPETIQSRCQIYQLKKITIQDVEQRLVDILKQEGIAFEEAAVKLVAREGRGSMRDALTLLDHAIALGAGKISVESMKHLVAGASQQIFLNILQALVDKTPAKILDAIAACDAQGLEMVDVIEHVATLARAGFIVKDLRANDPLYGLRDYSADELQSIRAIAQSASPFDLNRIFRTLMKCRLDMDGSHLDRFILENYCLEWCLDPGFASVKKMPVEVHVKPEVPGLPPIPMNVSAPQKKFPAHWQDLVAQWKQAKPLQARQLEEVYCVAYTPEKISLAVDENSFASQIFLARDEVQKIKSAFQDLFAFKGELEIKLKSQATAPVSAPASQTILQQREQQAEERRKDITEQLLAHPVTQYAVQEMKGKVTRIDIKDAPNL